jgi:hypothetical protein
MASTDNNNMSTMLGLGFKGAGKPNGVPAYNQTGVYCLGGVQNSADTQTMKYGVVVNSDPTQDDGIFSVGAVVTAGVASVFDWTITAACSADGNINIDGVVLAVTTTGQGTVNNVATAIRAMTLPRWTLTGSGAHVIFTAKAATVYAAPTYNFYSTGITRTTSTTTAGTVGTVPRGIVVYRPDIAMIDLSKPDYILQGTPLAVAYFGPIWIGSYGKTAANAIDPIIGAVVIAKNDTGVIEFQPAGTSSAPSGWYILANTTVKSVSLDTNGALLMVNI